MNHQELDHNAVIRLCNGDQMALDWVQLGRLYCHAIDDLIDEDLTKGNAVTGAERACKIGAMALQLYTHPFFLRHAAVLRSHMMLNTLTYADSVRWENDKEEWKRQFSDWFRHGWVQVCLVVGELCGGYDNARSVSTEMWTMAYANHHKPTGEAE